MDGRTEVIKTSVRARGRRIPAMEIRKKREVLAVEVGLAAESLSGALCDL